MKTAVRFLAISLLIQDVLASGKSTKDERVNPELRDAQRLAEGKKAQTDVGKQFVRDAEQQIEHEKANSKPKKEP